MGSLKHGHFIFFNLPDKGSANSTEEHGSELTKLGIFSPSPFYVNVMASVDFQSDTKRNTRAVVDTAHERTDTDAPDVIYTNENALHNLRIAISHFQIRISCLTFVIHVFRNYISLCSLIYILMKNF